jgi:hypothetical protein
MPGQQPEEPTPKIQWMACRWNGLTPSSSSYIAADTDGNRRDASMYPKRTGRNGPSVYQPGTIKWSRKLSAWCWQLTTNPDSRHIRTASDQAKVVIPHSGKSTTVGREQNGSSKGTSKDASTTIDHNILLNILVRDIKDNRFLKLIRQTLKAGYMEDWRYQATYSGTPQGGIVSPILANIVLNELDNFVQTELFSVYNRGERRKINPEYQRIQKRIRYARKKGRWATVKELERQRRQMPSGDPNDPDYRRIRYCRYADDFLIGYIGTRKEAEAIKEKIQAFLKTIKLDMSEEKTLVTHATSGQSSFLGIQHPHSNRQ